MSEKTKIVVHHSLTKDSKTVSWQAIRDYHVRILGWRAVGYHYGIEWIQNFPHIPGTYEILVGRHELERAAAVRERNMNGVGIHVCLIGNFDDAPPAAEMLEVAIDLVASIAVRHWIPADEVYGHREFAPYKSCPGTKFNLDEFRTAVRRRMG